MERRKFIAGNWKMNMTGSQATALINELVPLARDLDVDIAVAPTFTSLAPAAEALKGSNIRLAAQNVHWEARGAFTGEISADMLKELGVSYVIIGHSERRQYFGETDETVNLRTKAALAAGLAPIVCVGETLEEREQDKTMEVVGRQVRKALEGLQEHQVSGLTIAYEPVWAIGTGKVASTQQAQEVHAGIRRLLAELYNDKTADEVRIQYGGSMKPDNAADLLAQPDIDGGLIGGAALKAQDFIAICTAARR